MTITRRRFLQGAAALAVGAMAAPYAKLLAQPRFSMSPYTLGVASGYPHSSGVTLWTRLATESAPGMDGAHVEVFWEVAEDETFRRVAARGAVISSPALAHSVHIDVTGLEPARPYWYRFRVGQAVSPIGRTRTAPRTDAGTARMRFAFAACQQYEQGYFTAYRHMAREELDLVVHLGDYIYESSWGRNHVRAHGSEMPYTLDEYRARYALYKSDPDLQAAHAAFPWIVTWDDHEVENDYANDRSQFLDPREAFLARRAAAYQAYYEHMPLPRWALPRGGDMRVYGSTAYGTLASFFVLDTRQYRSHQVCTRPDRGGGNVVREEECAARRSDTLTMLGREQEQWLHESIGKSRARWNVVAQQTLMTQVDRRPGPGADYWTDGWDGYPRARERLLASLASQRVSNPIVVSGDVHMAAIADLRSDFDSQGSPVIATELVCPSISSQGPTQKRVEMILQENPHIRFANGARRGYTTVDVTPRRCVTRMRTISSEKEPDAPIRNLSIYAIEDGHPGAQRV
jgi:alkaline phosphatase D